MSINIYSNPTRNSKIVFAHLFDFTSEKGEDSVATLIVFVSNEYEQNNDFFFFSLLFQEILIQLVPI